MATGTLTSTNPAATYKSLLKVQGTNQVLDSTLRVIEDGDGNDSSLKLTLTGSTYGASFAGKVGIGVDDPDQPLEIACNDTTDITAANISNNSASGLHISNTNTAANDGAFIKFSTGTTESAIAHIEQSSGYPDLVFYTDNSGGTLTEAMRIDDSQNVGIGTTAPEALLHIHGTSAIEHIISVYSNTEANSGSLLFRKADSSKALVDDDAILGAIAFQGWDGHDAYRNGAQIVARINGTPADNVMPCDLEFWTNTGGTGTTQRMTISESGNVGIGTDAPSQPLHVATNSSADYVAKFANDGDNADRYGIIIQGGADDGSGTTLYITLNDGNGDTQGVLKSIDGTTSVAESSDIRLKKNIVDTEVEGLNTINNMKVRDYTFKKNNCKISAGFIANELVEVFEPAVSGEPDAMESYEITPKVKAREAIEAIVAKDAILDDDGNIVEVAVEAVEAVEAVVAKDAVMGERISPMMVSRDRLIPVLVKAIQELSAEVEKLKA